MRHDFVHIQTLRENERVAAAINRAWGARVAWVEEQQFNLPAKGKSPPLNALMPVVKSVLVRGLADGLKPPPFNGAPAAGHLFK